MILSLEMVVVVPGPETLPNWTLESTSAQIPSPVDPRKLTILLGGRMAQLGEGMAGPRLHLCPYLSHGSFMDLSCPHQCSNCWLKLTEK